MGKGSRPWVLPGWAASPASGCVWAFQANQLLTYKWGPGFTSGLVTGPGEGSTQH
jgi:hypothetical protein